MAGPRRKQKYVLVVVASLLLASGGLRVVTGAGPAIAIAEEQLAQSGLQAPENRQGDAEQVTALLAALQERESRVAQREIALNDRMQALALAESELTERLAQLQEAEASLSATLSLSETANDSDIARLTTVYENMKTADSAILFEEMAPEFAAGFLIRMRPEIAAAIMAGLEPQTAYTISVLIAGRNANAPTE